MQHRREVANFILSYSPDIEHEHNQLKIKFRNLKSLFTSVKGGFAIGIKRGNVLKLGLAIELCENFDEWVT